jgi:hypothetical protein
MLRLLRKFLVLICAGLLAFTHLASVHAARGAPGSPDFGIGAGLNLDGPYFPQALDAAADLDLDWVRVPLDWSVVQPDPAQPAHLEALDVLVQYFGQRPAAVLVALENAPEWARTADGPDPEKTAQFAAFLVMRYPQTVQAVELFPGANTRQGWGAPPDGRAYARLFRTVQSEVQATGMPVTLVAAGLRAGVVSQEDLQDTHFLAQLYEMDAAQWMPVLSLTYADTTGSPFDFPSQPQKPVLRHYEVVRQMMTANHHQNGLIWITQFSPPSGTINLADSAYQNANAQSNWMSQATTLLRSQLYIGVMFGQDLNPRSGGTGAGVPSLILAAGEIHPFYSVFREMISLNKTGSVSILPGKPKEGSLPKKRP